MTAIGTAQDNFTPIAPNIFPEQAIIRPDFDTQALMPLAQQLSPNNIGAVFDETGAVFDEKSRDEEEKSPDVRP